MKAYRNLDYITKRETLGKRLFLAAVLSLAGGLMVSFTPNMANVQNLTETNPIVRTIVENYAVISFATLIVGFVTASIGSYFINRFSARRWPNSKLMERPDQVLERLLKGLGEQYALFAYVVPGVSHLVIGPCGMIAFVIRSDKGRIMVKGDRWREPFAFSKLLTLFSREGLGNPAREVEEYVQQSQTFLNQVAQEAGEAEFQSIPVVGAVAFIHSEVDLDLDGPSVPVLRSGEILDFVRQTARESAVKNSLMRRFQQRLETQLAELEREARD